MKSVHENVKLVFILRNQVDRFWSSLRFNHTHNPDFDIEENFESMLVRQDFIRFVNYDRIIRAAGEHFSAEQVHIEFYENLFSGKAVNKFCAWLGIPFVAGEYSKRANAAAKLNMSRQHRRQAVLAYQQTYREIATRFGDRIPSSAPRFGVLSIKR